MDEELWTVHDSDTGNEVTLRRVYPQRYELSGYDHYDNALCIDLNQQHLWDLFKALSKELHG